MRRNGLGEDLLGLSGMDEAVDRGTGHVAALGAGLIGEPLRDWTEDKVVGGRPKTAASLELGLGLFLGLLPAFVAMPRFLDNALSGAGYGFTVGGGMALANQMRAEKGTQPATQPATEADGEAVAGLGQNPETVFLGLGSGLNGATLSIEDANQLEGATLAIDDESDGGLFGVNAMGGLSSQALAAIL